ncbi:hypothetical protein [Nocardia sp. NBC_01388]|uniref:hypothetical protein n=1 Tax=Nocardia sp. NBC_01388 TaxID=2903596 RepID=UPI003254D72E
MDFSKKFHEDHIFPKSRFTKKKLAAAGIAADKIDHYMAVFDLLPNLQLIPGTANIEKQDALPTDWIVTAFPLENKRNTYLHDNDLDGLPLGSADFTSFFQQRPSSSNAEYASAIVSSRSLERHLLRRLLRHPVDVGDGVTIVFRRP